jgi:hypothetical protein
MPRTSRVSVNLYWLNQWSRLSQRKKKTLLWTFAENVFTLIWICTSRNIDGYDHLPHPHDCLLYPQISHLRIHSGILLCFIFAAELLWLQLQRWQTGFFPGSFCWRFYSIQSSLWIWIKNKDAIIASQESPLQQQEKSQNIWMSHMWTVIAASRKIWPRLWNTLTAQFINCLVKSGLNCVTHF